MTLSNEEIHAFNHTLIRQRVGALIAGDLTGRKLTNARDILAFSIVGHDRLWPTCPAANRFDNMRLFD